MKKVSFLLIVLLLLTINLNAQVKYYIVFCAKEGAVTELTVGHAFISFCKEDDNKLASVTDGSWGLCPNSKKDLAEKGFLGEVPGHIANDFLTQIDNRLIVQVCKEQYDNALKIKNQWQAKGTYQLIYNDCVSFLIEVAKSINCLNVPDRPAFDKISKVFDNIPAKYLKTLIDQNKNINDSKKCMDKCDTNPYTGEWTFSFNKVICSKYPQAGNNSHKSVIAKTLTISNDAVSYTHLTLPTIYSV